MTRQCRVHEGSDAGANAVGAGDERERSSTTFGIGQLRTGNMGNRNGSREQRTSQREDRNEDPIAGTGRGNNSAHKSNAGVPNQRGSSTPSVSENRQW